MNDTVPPRPSRKPLTVPEQRHRGTPGGSGGTRAPAGEMLRPTAPLASVSQPDWLPFRDAIAQLGGIFRHSSEASDFLWLRILNGVIPITCEMLIYERADAGPRDRAMYPWPSAEARLWEQLLRAKGEERARFRWAATSGDVRWVDVSGPYPVNALALGLHVRRDAIHGYFLARVAEKTGRQMTPFNSGTPYADIEAWYIARVKTAPPEGYTRDEDEEAAKAVGIGRDRVRDLRKVLAPADWQKDGRKPRT